MAKLEMVNSNPNQVKAHMKWKGTCDKIKYIKRNISPCEQWARAKGKQWNWRSWQNSQREEQNLAATELTRTNLKYPLYTNYRKAIEENTLSSEVQNLAANV